MNKMIFSDSFAQILEELSKEVWSEVPRTQEGRALARDVLSCAVKSWCYRLNLPDDPDLVACYINKWHQSEISEVTDDIWQKWKPQKEHSLWGIQTPVNQFREYILRKVINRMNPNMGDIKFILLIALVVTGVGYTLYRLSQQSERATSSIKSSRSGSTLPPHQEKAFQGWNLVLVLNVGQEEVLESLRTNNRVMPHEGDALYRATQALWMGSEADFLKSELTSRFSNIPEEQQREKSEYDVYFVKIELHELESGFSQNASQIDRLDAFRKLHENSGKVEVSPRLPSKAYENTGVYR